MAATGLNVRAQSSGEKNSTLIVPFSPGSLLDIVARKFADALKESGMPAHLVENIPGASGILAGNQLLRRTPDGATILLASSGLICNAPLLSKAQIPFNPQADFSPICSIARTPFVLFSAVEFPANNLRDVQKLGSSRKEALLYAGAEPGSANHVAGEVVLERLGVRGVYVPYQQNTQAYIDVVERRVDLGIYGWNNISLLVRSGRAKILAVLSEHPLAVAPLLPTIASQGFGKFDIQGWYGIFARKGVPEPSLREYERQAGLVVNGRSFSDFLTETGQVPFFANRQEFGTFIAAEVDRYRKILSKLNLI